MTCIIHPNKPDRYGYIRLCRKGIKLYAHRLAYCLHNGVSLESIAEYVVRHTCDTPACVNPEHLLLGTHQDNMDDKVARGRSRPGQTNPNARLTDEQVRSIRHVYSLGGTSLRFLAGQYGVHNKTVLRIVKGVRKEATT